MKDNINYSIAGRNDKDGIIKLLKDCGLPFEDVTEEKLKKFFVARKNDLIIGCIGIEIFNNHGLLRSLAVSQDYRNLKIGSELYNKLIRFSIDSGVSSIHLLTTTAKNYFSRKGFVITGRSEAPQSIRETAEFSKLCPSGSTYMILNDY